MKKVLNKILNMKIFNINVKFLLFIAILVSGSMIYGIYKDKYMKSEQQLHYEIVRKHLLNDSPLFNKKPLIWIHINKLENPYMNLTIKSIEKHCGNDFNICIINDETFMKILPNWDIDLNYTSEPMKTKLRTLALVNTVQIYGGLLIPASFYCTNNLYPIYDELTQDDNILVGDFINRNVTANDYKLYVNSKLLGCKKDSLKMKEYVNHIQIIIANDSVSESCFKGSIDKWLEDRMKTNDINVISAEMLGLIDNKNKIITLDRLMSNDTTIELDSDALGIYIPNDELLKRKKYNWFTKLDVKSILDSNTFIGNYMKNN